MKNRDQIKAILDGLYDKYNRYELIEPDPLQFLYKFDKREDMEIAGLFSSCLAYGRVEQIAKSLTRLFGLMDWKPADFVTGFDEEKAVVLSSFKHRFNTGKDIADLCEILQRVYQRYSSLEEYFRQFYNDSDENVVPALTGTVDGLMGIYKELRGGDISKGFSYLLPNPTAGSACKRLNLFLRWMVREDAVDSGLWESIDPGKLVVPVDVHMGRLCRYLGLYERRGVSLKTALEITEGFRNIEPEDPVKYDFALSRVGIVESCTGREDKFCRDCGLFGICRRREDWKYGQ